MTIWQTVRSAVEGRSKYKQHGLSKSRPNPVNEMSRQQERRAALATSVAAVNRRNPDMPRRDRRTLALAYAVAAARDARKARAAKAAA